MQRMNSHISDAVRRYRLTWHQRRGDIVLLATTISVPVAMGIAVVAGDRLPVLVTVALGVGVGSWVGLVAAKSMLGLLGRLSQRDECRSPDPSRGTTGTERLWKDPPLRV